MAHLGAKVHESGPAWDDRQCDAQTRGGRGTASDRGRGMGRLVAHRVRSQLPPCAPRGCTHISPSAMIISFLPQAANETSATLNAETMLIEVVGRKTAHVQSKSFDLVQKELQNNSLFLPRAHFVAAPSTGYRDGTAARRTGWVTSARSQAIQSTARVQGEAQLVLACVDAD